MVRLFGKKQEVKQVELAVEGMSCAHCEMRVKKALTGVEGVQGAEVSLTRGQAVVIMAPGQEVDVNKLVAAVEAAGYHARSMDAEPPRSS